MGVYRTFNEVVMQLGRLSSRVVSVLDSGAEGPGFKSQPRRCLCSPSSETGIAALLRVAGVIVGLVESNGSLPPAL